MAKDDKISIADVKAYLLQQLLEQQLTWREHREAGDDISRALADAQEAVMDKLYEFANAFWGQEIPAPGQGYEPPEDIYADRKREQQLEFIDAQVNELLRQRQAVIDGSSEQPPVPKPPVTANATLATGSRVAAQVDGSAPDPSGSGGVADMEPRDEG
jgi:hypothetical protein